MQFLSTGPGVGSMLSRSLGFSAPDSPCCSEGWCQFYVRFRSQLGRVRATSEGHSVYLSFRRYHLHFLPMSDGLLCLSQPLLRPSLRVHVRSCLVIHLC